MTNPSTYAYGSLEDYMLLYPNGQDIIAETHLSALHINKKSVVLVADTSEKVAGVRPDFSKSLVYFDHGEKAFEKYEKQFEPVVAVKVDGDALVFEGQEITKELAIARKYGDVKNGSVMGYILYDDTRPRLNVIMVPVKH